MLALASASCRLRVPAPCRALPRPNETGERAGAGELRGKAAVERSWLRRREAMPLRRLNATARLGRTVGGALTLAETIVGKETVCGGAPLAAAAACASSA